MSYAEVCEAVKKIKNKYMEKDPFRLCEAMGIRLIPRSFGTAPNCIKGFYTVKYRIKIIVYNSDLPELLQKMIIFHEIGHSVLHSGEGIANFTDFTMYDTNSRTENEANLFAAEYMLNDDEVIETLNEDTSFFSAASRLNVPPEVFDYKFRVMKWKGYRMSESPVAARSNFLKSLEVSGYHESNPD